MIHHDTVNIFLDDTLGRIPPSVTASSCGERKNDGCFLSHRDIGELQPLILDLYTKCKYKIEIVI